MSADAVVYWLVFLWVLTGAVRYWRWAWSRRRRPVTPAA